MYTAHQSMGKHGMVTSQLLPVAYTFSEELLMTSFPFILAQSLGLLNCPLTLLSTQTTISQVGMTFITVILLQLKLILP